ncbi:phage protein [Gluconobacter frateurii M-2]|nr:phage protein [Gluconobacter frateurii M-2]
MLYRSILRDLAAEALKAANTIAGENVLTARSLPIRADLLPVIYLQVPDDRGESAGRFQPQFTRVATLAIRGKLQAGTPFDVELALEGFAEQIELALMTDADLQAAITQVTELSTSIVVSSDQSEHIGELRMILGLEYIETYPPPGTPLAEIDATLFSPDNPAFAGLRVDFPTD